MTNIFKEQYKIAHIKKGFSLFLMDMFTYSTIRAATIQSMKVGIVYRIVQFLLLSYIIGWELIHNKNYQKFDTVSSVVTTKVKGQGFVPINARLDAYNRSDPNYYENLFGLKLNTPYKILDTADYIIPPSEYNSIFIMTNFLETQQTQGSCDEEINRHNSVCSTDFDCKNIGRFMNTWNGIPTGNCIQSSVNENYKVCEIKGWCPSEHDSERKEDNIIRNVLNYTVLIKNDIEFKKLNKKERNILWNITNKYISRCIYDHNHDIYCPVFKLDYILKRAEPNETERYLMLIKGGVVSVEIIWNCDYDIGPNCFPKYNFKRFDVPFSSTSTASGFNFRYASKYKDGGVEHRILYKAFGLRIIINVSGTGGKFNIVPLMLSIGAGLGLMSISVLFADCVMLHCTTERTYFGKKIYNDDELKFLELSNIAYI